MGQVNKKKVLPLTNRGRTKEGRGNKQHGLWRLKNKKSERGVISTERECLSWDKGGEQQQTEKQGKAFGGGGEAVEGHLEIDAGPDRTNFAKDLRLGAQKIRGAACNRNKVLDTGTSLNTPNQKIRPSRPIRGGGGAQGVVIVCLKLQGRRGDPSQKKKITGPNATGPARRESVQLKTDRKRI